MRTRTRRWATLVLGAVLIALLAVGVHMAFDAMSTNSETLGAQSSSVAQFDLTRTSIPRNKIMSGGPPKDGIPAISAPKFVGGRSANYLRPNERVVGVVMHGEARAYPLGILNFHEVVNDQIGETPFAVTYCPLCDSAAVFDRRTPLGVREFGVSGLLYNSNVLMYDRRGKPEGLWSQVMTEGISGPATGKRLVPLPLELTTWKDWLDRHPDTKVLSNQTGFARDYRANPYSQYFTHPNLYFPVEPLSRRLPLKTPVLGVWTDTASRAYPVPLFEDTTGTIEDRVGGRKVTLQFNAEADSLRIVRADAGVNWMYSFWFAWYAFHPGTDIYTAR